MIVKAIHRNAKGFWEARANHEELGDFTAWHRRKRGALRIVHDVAAEHDRATARAKESTWAILAGHAA